MHLVDGFSQFNGISYQQYLATIWKPVASRSGLTYKPITGDNISVDNPAILHISHGRMVATCPNCNGAEFVWRDGPHIMLCALCGNMDVDFNYRLVIMPNEEALKSLEVELLRRPNPANRNWYPDESIEAIKAENEANL